jgi:ribosomal protein L40E
MAVKVCTACGEANKETAHICIVCSESLKAIVPVGTLDSEKQEYEFSPNKRSPICKHCNEKVEEGALKCRYCGTLISRVKPSKSVYATHYASNTSPDGCAVALLFIATFIVPLVGLIVGGIFAFNDDVEKQDLGKLLLGFGLAMIVVDIVLVLIFA